MSLKPEELLPLARRLPEPYLLVDAAGTVLAANPAACAALGLAAERPDAASLSDHVREPPEKLLEYLRQCSRSGQFLPGRFTCSGPGGVASYRCEGMAARSADDFASPARILLRLLPEERAGMRFALLDRKIDELARENARRRTAEAERERLLEAERQARREAEEANRLKDDFLATVSHELRTPLNVISGWVEILADEELPGERRRRGLDAVGRNVRALTQLVDDLLDLSRIVTGGLRLDVRPIELAPLVQAAADSVAVAAEAKEIDVQVAAERDTGVVSGDSARLQQVLWNLLSNAVKFTPRGGEVRVELARVGSQVEVAVRDSGVGIDAEFLPHVFDSFRQRDSSITRAYQGLGLGLAIVRRLVEAHGGTVAAESAGVGQGATFRLRLPLRALARPPLVGGQAEAEPARAPERDGVAATDRLRGLRVLLVEDDPDARELLITLLERGGAQVAAAASAREARELLPRQPPDVLISDIQMPGEDGYSFLRELRASGGPGAGVPALALTAHGRREDRQRAREAGFQLHVTKPVEPEELLRLVASLAADRGAPPGADGGGSAGGPTARLPPAPP